MFWHTAGGNWELKLRDMVTDPVNSYQLQSPLNITPKPKVIVRAQIIVFFSSSVHICMYLHIPALLCSSIYIRVQNKV